MNTKNQKPFTIAAKAIALSILISITCISLAKYILEPQDNTRCKSMLTEGKWLTEEYKQWQPDGCMAKTYHKEEIGKCLGHSRIVYIGDSIMREQYYAMTSFLRRNHPSGTPVHDDQKEYYKAYNLTIEMWWDPYLNSSKTVELLEAKQQGSRPSLLVIGSGIWYMRRLGSDYLPLWKQAVDRVFDGAIHHSVADRIMLSPVEIVEYDLMIPERKATLTSDKITLMNNYLREREANLHQPTTPLVVPFVWNKIVTSSKNQTKDGLHFKEPVTRAEAQLALNYRCNNDPSIRKDTYPINSTCCYSYAKPLWYQNTVIAFFLCFIPIYILITNSFSENTLQWMNFLFTTDFEILKALFVFGLAVVYMFMGDRTQLFGKIFKQFDALTFSVLTMFVLFLGAVTLKSSGEEANGFLNRHQTEEWKGWMQLVILIYHFTGASRIAGIYNPIRILVAAYLFQTGYGHFFFFYKKKDFGIARVLNIMVRLNLLSCVLAYLMRTDYLFYYFSPLVSFWFSIIWVTMRIMSSYNQKVWFMISKIVVMSLFTAFLIHYPGLLEAIFRALSWLFNIQWNVIEWRFRLSLDCWIVYIGMLCALVTIKISEHELDAQTWLNCKIGSLILSVIGLAGYFWFEVLQTKVSYNAYHPYISWVPILSFVALRNASASARSTYSGFFAFIGKISLETFIGQFHMWLAADTQGLLVVLPSHWVRSSLGWWVNLIVSSIVFFFVCYHLSWTTGSITQWLCSGTQASRTPNNNNKTGDTVPLLPTSEHHVHTEKSQKSTEEEQSRGCSSDEISLDAWEEPAKSSPAWYETLYDMLCQNYLIRSLLFFVILGTVNHFCT